MNIEGSGEKRLRVLPEYTIDVESKIPGMIDEALVAQSRVNAGMERYRSVLESRAARFQRGEHIDEREVTPIGIIMSAVIEPQERVKEIVDTLDTFAPRTGDQSWLDFIEQQTALDDIV